MGCNAIEVVSQSGQDLLCIGKAQLLRSCGGIFLFFTATLAMCNSERDKRI